MRSFPQNAETAPDSRFRWSRRWFLAASGTAAATSLLLTPRAGAATGFEHLRKRWRDLILGTGFDAAAEPFATQLTALGTTAAQLRTTMNPSTGSLWLDAVFADPEPDLDTESYRFSSAIQTSYGRLLTMATAYAQPGTGLTGDTGLRNDILTGLEHMYRQVYNERQARYGNWYNWQIGGPQALLDVCVLLYDHIPADRRTSYLAAVDHFVPDSAVANYTGTSTGANRVDLCRVLALRGVVGDDAAKLSLARDALSPVFPYVSRGDGLYRDGSFVQHRNVAYSGSYGSVFLGGLGLLFALLADSPWQVTDPNRQIVLDSVERAWAPWLFNGLIADAVCGRAISRGAPGADGEDDHSRGHAVIASIALMAQGASAAERSRWQQLVKGWIDRDHYRPILTDPLLRVPALARLKTIWDDDSITPAAEPVGHRLFAAMDRAVHRRPGWAATLSMASRRIAHYEYGNQENARGWHTGSGMLQWWRAEVDNGQYSDDFWPTVDPYRLPGTTVSTKRLADGEGGNWGQPAPAADWVGGVTDDTFAVVGQHLRGISSTLSARKSWFFTDEAVICLGAGITAQDGTTVETVIDNRNLGATGTAPLTVNGSRKPTAFPYSASLTGVRWAHLTDHGGYLFPDTTTVHSTRETRTGRWRDINANGSEAEITRRYQTLHLNHGTNPVDAGYQYVLLPGATMARTATLSATASRWLRILSNTADAQAVSLPHLGLTAVNFWAAGSVAPFHAGAPCSVLLHIRPDHTATLCVSDPTRTLRSLHLTYSRPVAAVLSQPATVTATRTGAGLEVEFGDLTGTIGTTQRLELLLA
ncbi:polysaccharide lyase 8 family protein [Saccharothrix sp.]|uniref:polysaccharide lyase 8 family protein n=1 Tax=Saccharothrix sp. TaxID=1873460 RepID=UPI0028118230|nr:polysaccharide lyase 8 family protein [Saccharothrix sp.]